MHVNYGNILGAMETSILSHRICTYIEYALTIKGYF